MNILLISIMIFISVASLVRGIMIEDDLNDSQFFYSFWLIFIFNVFVMTYFRQTSEEPYLRHDYKIHFHNKKAKTVDNYADAMEIWFSSNKDSLKFIEVLDHKKGFG